MFDSLQRHPAKSFQDDLRGLACTIDTLVLFAQRQLAVGQWP